MCLATVVRAATPCGYKVCAGVKSECRKWRRRDCQHATKPTLHYIMHVYTHTKTDTCTHVHVCIRGPLLSAREYRERERESEREAKIQLDVLLEKERERFTEGGSESARSFEQT